MSERIPVLETTTHPSQAPLVSGKTHSLIVCLLLVVGTLAVYNGVTKNRFINYDDDVYVTANRHVQSGLHWTTLQWAFTTFDAANWHPVTWISHALDYQLFKLNPAGHHYTNVLLHAVNVILLFLLFLRATARVWPSLAVAAIFAVHPLNVESVAWAAERKNVLSMLFMLLALMAYERYVRKPGFRRYLAVFFLFAFGLMAKPQVITFPFLLLLWDYWPLARFNFALNGADAPGPSFASLVFEKVPLFALSLASAMVTMAAQRAGGAVRSAIEYPFLVRIENAVGAYFDYFARLLWPLRLAPMYPHPGTSLRAWQIGVAAAFLITVTALVFRYRKKRYLAVGWLWYLGALVPMIGLVQVGLQATADRYTYVPMIGLLIMVCWTLDDWARDRVERRIGLAAGIACVLLALSILTVRQVTFWRNSETLWTHAVEVTQGNYIAHVNLGETFINQERTEEAAAHFRAAVQIRPNDPAAHLNLGTCERRRKHFPQALQEDMAVLQLTSDQSLRAYALVNMGTDYRRLLDYQQAKAAYEAALRIHPEAARAFVGLGLLAQKSGEYNEAVRNFGRAAELEPSDVAYLLLAGALHQNGQARDAQAAFESAQRVSPDFERAQKAVRDLQEE